MSIQQNFPSTRPSLNLNFARSQKLDPRITFTRTSSATRVNSNGLIEVIPANSPRFDFDPTTGESLGLLVEEARTNFVRYSKNIFNDSGAEESRWSIIDSTVGGWPTPGHGLGGPGVGTLTQLAAIAPDGTLTASYFNAIGVNYLRSPRVESGNNMQGFNAVTVNLSTGTITSANASASPASIASVGNGWHRISWNGAGVVGATSTCSIYAKSGETNILKLGFSAFFGGMCMALQTGGTASQGVYVWGAQIEAGSFPTSYIPTTTATVTRAADVASVPTTGWMDTTGGTILTEYYRLPLTSFFYASLWSLGYGNPALGYTNGGLHTDCDSVGVGQGYISFPVLPGKNRAAFKFQNVGQWSTTQNGATPQSSIISSAWSSSPTVLDLGYSAAVPFGGWRANAPISRLIYWPTRLPDSMLQTLTK